MKIKIKMSAAKLRATCMALWTVFAAGCVNEDWSGCFPPTITVTLQTVAGHDPILPEEVDHLWLYVFESAGGRLLERIRLTPDQIGVPQTVDYPQAGELTVVAVVNALDRTTLGAQNKGDRIASAAIGLIPAGQNAHGIPNYETCDDLMWGKTVVANQNGASENAVLPVKRIVAGVYIRITGLENIPGVDPAQVGVALGTRYNRFGFEGVVGNDDARSAAMSLCHVVAAGPNPHNMNVVEAPAYAEGEPQFFRILSTDAGDDVTISLYNGAIPFGTDLTHDTNGNPLKARNGKLNVFELDFDDRGQIGVTVSQAKWGDTPDMEIDF